MSNSTQFCGYYLQEPRGAICHLNSVTGTAYITNSENGALTTFLRTSCKLWSQTLKNTCLLKLMQGGMVCIPDKANSRTLHEFDRALYKVGNVVERFFLKIKNRRRVATRYDKLAVCFLNFVILSALLIQL